MKFLTINNPSNLNLDKTEELFHSLGQYAQKQFGFKNPPVLNLVSDVDNSLKPLGKTAHYNPKDMEVSIYVDGRHPKDILRSFAHELVHHTQNENGQLNTDGYHGEGYAQKNKDLRNMESDAYERGNMCFRDWEDSLKQNQPTIYNERRIKKMSTKDWKNKELSENLNKKWGFRMNLKKIIMENKYSEKDPADYTGTKKAEDEAKEDLKVGKLPENKEITTEAEGSKDHEYKRVDKSAEHPVGHRAGDKSGHYKDYMGPTGGNEGDESKTHPGEKDYMKEDSGEDEAWNDWKNEHADDDHIKEIEPHLRALRDDRDYEEKDAEYDDDKYEDEGYKVRKESKIKKAIRKMVLQELKRRKNGRK